MDDRSHRHAIVLAVAAGIGGMLSAGCKPEPLRSPYPVMRVVAIAPFLNQTGSPAVEPLAVSDIFFSELQMVPGFQVLPVNRSLQQMAAMGLDELRGPVDALRLAEGLGADMIVVGAVTAYDPYDPPEVGLAIQLYIRPGPQAMGNPAMPRSQVNEVYNAAAENLQKKIRQFADLRDAGQDPLGWQIYVRSIQHYMRFCCHEAIAELIRRESWRIRGPVSAPRSP